MYMRPEMGGWEKFGIDCERCFEEFSLVQQPEKTIILTHREEVDRKKRLKDEAAELTQQLMRSLSESGKTDQLLKSLEDALEALPSKAAVYGYLQRGDLHLDSLSTFRRHLRGYRSLREWVDGQYFSRSPAGLRRIAKLVGVDISFIDPQLGEIRRKERAATEPYTQIGEPVFRHR